MDARERLIVALDGDWSLDELEGTAAGLGREIGLVKVGKRLFVRHGPDALRRLNGLSLKVFLDLKFHDIPNTVRDACREATAMGCAMLNVHASGGRDMMLGAREGVDEAAGSLGVPPPRLLAVTVLTSLDDDGLAQIGVTDRLADQVRRLAALAAECGMDGVVASPREVGLVRDACGDDFLVVTPGVRPGGAVAGDDQRRVMTPLEAIRAGADYIVVGRPIYGAPDPVEAARGIVAQLREV